MKYILPMEIALENIMHTSTDKDVWGHIVKYFRFSLSDESVEDIRIKRRTLCSIALVSSRLTSVAVSELWRSMETLEPVIHVFNPYPFRILSPAFVHGRDIYSDYWDNLHVSDPLTNGVKSRVLDYLSHVQYLRFPISPSPRERALWLALQAFGWINPLCPNLRGITFTGANNHPSIAHCLAPFMVPSVESIRFDSATTAADEKTAMMLLSMIKHRKIQISHIAYVGYASPRIIKFIFQFSNLRSVKVHVTSGYHEHLEASDIGSFRPSTVLTNLYLDIGMFQPNSQVGHWIETLQSLSTLSLQGTALMITDCLKKREFAPVYSLTLFFRQPNRTPYLAPSIFTMVSIAFPNLHNLHLENKENYNIMTAAITPTDIHPLRERPMRCLDICCLSLSLSTSNVFDIVGTWPTLERLSLVPDPRTGFGRYHVSELLPYISQHAPHVTDLNLPLDMSSFTTQPLTPGMSVCPLLRLELTYAQNLPSSLEGKLTLARNLVTLFPRLDVVTSNVDVRELQLIVSSFRGMLSSLPIRSDNLYWAQR